MRGIGPRLGRQLIRACGDIFSLWGKRHKDWHTIDGVGPKLAESLEDSEVGRSETIIVDCQRLNLSLLCPDDESYPEMLRPLDDAPLTLFVQGDISALSHTQMLAVVGTRHASREGRLLAERWCRRLSERDVCIVSGMAYGIDAAAHAGALESDGPTIAVLGCGLAAITGPEQQGLMGAIAAQGCVISEFLPDTTPRPEYFPQRNRIIAGLAEATLVVEAGLKSGALITAGHALSYGREVMAVPGQVLAGRHAGCHKLIRDGACLVETVSDVMAALGWQNMSERSARAPAYQPASEEEARILDALKQDILHIDALAEQCGLTVPELSPILVGLELLGVVESLPGGRYTLATETGKSP